jgi:hypothetical protein
MMAKKLECGCDRLSCQFKRFGVRRDACLELIMRDDNGDKTFRSDKVYGKA